MPDINDEVIEMIKQAACAASEEGATRALEKFKRTQEKESKKTRDRRLRNTRKLLENYRRLKRHAESAVYSSMQEEVEDIINEMWDPNDRSEQIVFSIKSSATRTSIIMAHVTAEIEEYRRLCYASPNQIDRDRADALFARYIDENEMTIEEIADKLCVGERTVQRYIERATKDVSVFMFGIDGLVVVKNDYNDKE